MTTDRTWHGLYLAGGIVAFVALGGMLLDIALSMAPGWAAASVPVAPADWFAQLAADPLLGMRNLDVLNITISVVSLPMYVALFGVLRTTARGPATLGLLFVTLGTALFLAANAALPMLELSRRFAEASDPAARASLLAAADALLARGAHGSFGAFPGFFLSEVGTALVALAMVRSGALGSRIGWIGLAGTAILSAYTVACTFGGGADALMMAVAVPGGLLMIAWHAMVGTRLVRVSRP